MTSYQEFLQACQVIGGAASGNGRFTELLYRLAGDNWQGLSLGDMLVLIKQARRDFNSIEMIARGEA